MCFGENAADTEFLNIADQKRFVFVFYFGKETFKICNS